MSMLSIATEIPKETSPTLAVLIDELGEYMPGESIRAVEEAYDFAAAAHAGQTRLSGEPYLVHLVATAYYLACLRLDPTSVVAGLLHDTIEDTEATQAEIEERFGHSVARIVEGVSKFGEIGHRHRILATERDESDERRVKAEKAKQQAENVRKMFLAMAEDPRVVIVKLADRLHNMRTLDFQPVHKQERIALDTREIYAPLAGRLGIGQVKGPLEDLAFKYLEPDAYRWLVANLAEQRAEREAYINNMAEQLRAHLQEHGIE